MRDFGERRAQAVKFFKRPDTNYFGFDGFLKALLEQVFVYDALSVLMRPRWGKGLGRGLLGSDLDSFELVDGATIRPLLNLHGGVPRPPAPAWQQYLKGVPRSDFTTMWNERDIEEAGLRGAEAAAFRNDQMLYLPTNPRANTPYGFGATEQALIVIMTGLRKQAYQLEYYSEGTVPGRLHFSRRREYHPESGPGIAGRAERLRRAIRRGITRSSSCRRVPGWTRSARRISRTSSMRSS